MRAQSKDHHSKPAYQRFCAKSSYLLISCYALLSESSPPASERPASITRQLGEFPIYFVDLHFCAKIGCESFITSFVLLGEAWLAILITTGSRLLQFQSAVRILLVPCSSESEDYSKSQGSEDQLEDCSSQEASHSLCPALGEDKIK